MDTEGQSPTFGLRRCLAMCEMARHQMFEVCFFKDSVIERHSHTRFMDTRLKQTSHYYGQKKLMFFTRISVFPWLCLMKHWDSCETKWIVSLGTCHQSYNTIGNLEFRIIEKKNNSFFDSDLETTPLLYSIWLYAWYLDWKLILSNIGHQCEVA